MDTSKIIKGVVGGGRYTVTAPIVKEDYGLYLLIEGLELPQTYEVDFSNDEHNGTSVTMIGNSDGVLIPRQFISSGKDIFAFLYHVGEDYGRTVYKFRIPNKLRPDRTDEEPTPEEQSVIDQTIAALNDAVESAQEAQQAIEDMSVSATTLAEGASATVTKSEQDGVVHLAFGIPTGATGAQGVKGDKGDKGDTGAQGIKGDKGEKGDTGAPGAKGDKGDKGDTGEQGIQGIQGEKGEQGIQGEKGEKGDKGDKGDTGEVTTEEFLKAFVTDSASGSIASFPDGADDIPLKSLVVDIDPVQDLSNGDPSPDNICPISGWEGMQIRHTKKNLLPLNIWRGIPYNASEGRVFEPVMTDDSWTQESDRISYTTTSTYTVLSLMSPLLPKGTYRLSVHKFSSGALRYTRYVLDKNYTVKMSVYSANVTNNSVVVTLDEDGYIAVCLDNGSVASQTIEATIQLEIGNTETAYEPYTGRSITIDLGQTVYGCKLDVLSGVMRVTHGIDLIKNLTWTYQSANTRFYSASLIGQIKAPSNNANVVNAISESYKVNSFSAYTDKQFSVSTSGGLVLKDSSYTDVASFVEAMGEYQICYELATPLTVQLDAHTLNSLYGQNNIFADTGDAHVEYRADTKLYIEKLTQPEEDDMVADSAISSGQFFMIGNSLYRALANIASGATITVGTNAQRVSLSDALNLVNA